MSDVKVEQCDREAAASVAVLVEMRELILAGRADHHAEPFAKHRTQHGAQSGPTEWADIATAPKDGTFIQLFDPLAQPPVSVGCYDDEAGWLICEADFMPSKRQPRCWAPLLPRPDITPATKSDTAQVSDIVDDRVSTPNPVADHETVKTSDKLRDAVEVWEDAYRAWDDAPINPYRIGDEDRAAAAVIEADRAALVAEIVAMIEGHRAFHLSAVEEAHKSGADAPAIEGGVSALSVLRRDIKAKWGTSESRS